jgi:hypothetical protein
MNREKGRRKLGHTSHLGDAGAGADESRAGRIAAHRTKGQRASRPAHRSRDARNDGDGAGALPAAPPESPQQSANTGGYRIPLIRPAFDAALSAETATSEEP